MVRSVYSPASRFRSQAIQPSTFIAVWLGSSSLKMACQMRFRGDPAPFQWLHSKAPLLSKKISCWATRRPAGVRIWAPRRISPIAAPMLTRLSIWRLARPVLSIRAARLIFLVVVSLLRMCNTLANWSNSSR